MGVANADIWAYTSRRPAMAATKASERMITMTYRNRMVLPTLGFCAKLPLITILVAFL
jgi:hypothetical protein